ncbi:MAG: HAD-IIIA family hydrolase [Proteobacteria bacterium]|nr:HAD-IIIA family hydrolase [Pseudomonadota bacterium]HQR03429.1 HAD-IIIA family hydrolase [Rhodocyclaceae bacterium]
MKQVVILAGGKGTRLRERLGSLPKPLVDICGIPLLERQILLAKRYGFTHVLILVSYAAGQILDFCASRYNWGLDIRCLDDGEPRGTAGATLAVFDQLADEFLVMYGDTMLEVNLAGFHRYHQQFPDAAATLFLHPNDHPHDSDLVEMNENGQITAFHPYPHDNSRFYPNLVNAALYWVNRKSLSPWRHESGMLDFGKEIFPSMLRSGQLLRGFNSPEYIKDIGTPPRLDRVCADFAAGKIARSSLDQPQSIVFIDRDGTLNREVDHLDEIEKLELLPDVGRAIRRLNQSEYRCCVVTNQPVVARGECSIEDLHGIHYKMETLLGQVGAFVDRIYYCPHHPERGFDGEIPELKVVCDCRKPRTGMVERGLHELNGARGNSWLVGDSSVDIETARRAGIRSILVETGYAGLDGREWALPDTIVPDLSAAVDFILDQYPRLRTACQRLVADISPGELVFIGGLSRSGKSTFANILRDAILAQGLQAKVLTIDRWLRSKGKRENGVFGRYDMKTLHAVVEHLRTARPVILALPGYHKLRRERIEDTASIEMLSEDVIIIEGTVALELATHSATDHRYHVEIDEAVRKQRVLREYRQRGKGETDALRIYAERQEDESPIIQSLGCGATRISFADFLE